MGGDGTPRRHARGGSAPPPGPRLKRVAIPTRRPRYRGTHPRRFEERYKERDPARFPEMERHIRAQGRTPAGSHVPVMVEEILAALEPHPGDCVVDATLGHGGHAAAILPLIVPGGHLWAMDQDRAELEATRARFKREHPQAPITFVHRRFAGLGKLQSEYAPEGFDLVLADLGLSSMQIDDPARGFSYKHDGPLDMRMDPRLTTTAAAILADRSEEELTDLFETLGDEPHAGRIARKIVAKRADEAITRTRTLVRLILEAKRITPEEWKAKVEAEPGALHPAARAFQALRMVVNDEMGQLDHLLRTLPFALRPGGRVAILSFHSGEDQRVRRAFEDGLADETWSAISPGSLRPTAMEKRDNPRSASAMLRWAKRAGAGRP